MKTVTIRKIEWKAALILKKLWFVAILSGLVLIMGRTAYSDFECSDCHVTDPEWPYDVTNLYEGLDSCAGCHSVIPHAPSGFTIPDFHSADGLICNKCHTMHYSEAGAIPSKANGAPVDADVTGPYSHLIYKASVTDLCLVCHADIVNGIGAPIVMTADGTGSPNIPGGDFFHSRTSQGKGHNPGGFIGSGSLAQAPGGSFSSSDETCISCHDEHGDSSEANDYRLLKKKPGGWTGSELIVTGVKNHAGTDEGGGDGTNIPKYYTGFSAWCGACHSNPDSTPGNNEGATGFHGSTKDDPDVGDESNWIRHPTDRDLGTGIAGNYSTTYDWHYPIEDDNENEAVEASDEVFCLSCHRAHATPYFNSTRGDNSQPSGAGTGCNKCHNKG